MNIITPVNADKLEQYLVETQYDECETEFLVKGFREGFDIGYAGEKFRRDTAANLPLKVGSKQELWEKIMKEVELRRYAGPFTRPPFKYYVQSPIGLVPKSGNKTRLIFHLSYGFGKGKKNSINGGTPKEMCTVQYNDLDYAIQSSFKWALNNNIWNDQRTCAYAKTDVQSAFRLVPLSRKTWNLLLMAAEHPQSGKKYWFVKKCLSFGHSISCCHFQRFSSAVKHIFEHKSGRRMSVTNYLDDFLFVAASKDACNAMVRQFISICIDLGIPLAEDKTEWGTYQITFLGIILNGDSMSLSIPEEKRMKALNELQRLTAKRKATVKELQSLAGLLNFLNKAIHPGRAFTRRMYAKFSLVMDTKIPGLNKPENPKLKPHHHISLDKEFKDDCSVWMQFLDKETLDSLRVNRPMVDADINKYATELNFYSDASGAREKGFGAVYKSFWTYSAWEKGFIEKYKPSIEYLELYALCIGIFTWGKYLKNSRFWIFCDNESVERMVNNITSGCKNCMKLIRMLVLRCLDLNLRIFVKHVSSKDNYLADSLSRIRLDHFWKKVREDEIRMNLVPDPLPEELWPVTKIWVD